MLFSVYFSISLFVQIKILTFDFWVTSLNVSTDQKLSLIQQICENAVILKKRCENNEARDLWDNVCEHLS